MGVEEHASDDGADGCIVSGDGAVRVGWRKGAAVDTTLSHFTVQAFDATTYLPATAEVVVDGHTGEGLCPGVCTQNVFNGQPEPCYAAPRCARVGWGAATPSTVRRIRPTQALAMWLMSSLFPLIVVAMYSVPLLWARTRERSELILSYIGCRGARRRTEKSSRDSLRAPPDPR